MSFYKHLAFLLLSICFIPSHSIGQAFAEDIIPIDIESTQKTELITIDVNGDGDLDIIHRGQELVLYLNIGNFEYERQGVIDFGVNIDFFNFDVKDLDNDGLEDIIIIDNAIYPAAPLQLKNLGDGTFAVENIISDNSILGVVDISVGDYDNDGDMDLLINNANMSLVLYEQLENGSFDFFSELNGFNGICLNYVDFIDLNNDGNLDLVGTYNDGLLIWFENLGGDNFSDFRIILNDPYNLPFYRYDFIDYDQDDDLDVILGVDNSDQTVWVENDNGVFNQVPFTEDPIFNFATVSVGDVENDDDTDMIFGGNAVDGDNTTQELRLYLNNGNGGFQSILVSIDFERICNTELVDLNNDTFKDLLVTYSENAELKYAILPNVLNTTSINGCIFFDQNENGIRDENEQHLDGIQVDLDPENLKLQTNEDGCYRIFVDDGTYTVTPDFPSIWKLTTDSSSFTVTINGDSFSGLDFGFAPTQQLLAGQMHAVSGITRCNRETKFDFIFQNMGTTIITDGVIWVFPDDLVSLAGEIDPIDTIGVTGEWGWKFEDLYPGETIKKSLLLNIPGLGGDIEPGTLIKLFSATEATNTQGFTNFFKHNFESEILCAYDPNDKLVRPDREGDENYTQFKDTMIYTVRFQNTGNDTAFTVEIRDTLDVNLDVSTFNILGSSHREVLSTQILDDRYISFTFENILLPDSTIDFVGSQGFVSYSIEPKDGLEENTIIENTASIYFDFNPPIVTNTTQNTMVECLPISPIDISVIINEGETYTLPDGTVVNESGVYTSQILDADNCPIEIILTVLEVLTSTKDLEWNRHVTISPNPTKDFFYLDIQIDESIDHDLVIYNILGEEVSHQRIQSKSNRVDIEGVSTGTYMLQLRSTDGELAAVKKLVVL